MLPIAFGYPSWFFVLPAAGFPIILTLWAGYLACCTCCTRRTYCAYSVCRADPDRPNYGPIGSAFVPSLGPARLAARRAVRDHCIPQNVSKFSVFLDFEACLWLRSLVNRWWEVG